MGSQVLKVLRQGVWGSLTGGWYFDPRHSKFTNVFHLYTWLILMSLPFVFYMVPSFGSPWAVVGTYAATVFTLFAGIKTTNYRLHTMFDEGDIVERKVVRPDDGTVEIDEAVTEDNANSGDGIQPAVVVPVLRNPAPFEQRAQEDGATAAKIVEDQAAKGDSADRITKRDLEADVHVDSVAVTVEIQTNNNDTSKDIKKIPKKRRHRQRSTSGGKAVAFADVPAQTKKRVDIDRCVSLSSASSDLDKSGTDDDEYSSNTESTGSSSGDEESSDEDTNELNKEVPNQAQKLRPRARAIRRRAIRGHAKHPWRDRPANSRPKVIPDKPQDERESSVSSSCSDPWSKVTDNNDEQKQFNPETSQLGASQASSSGSRRKRVSTGRPTVSPLRKLPALETGPDQETQTSNRSNQPTENETPMQLNHNREGDRDIANSDQELLVRDPVWRARRSRRYNSDHRLFFRRRSYTVNSNRSRERENRRRLSTVPPYSARRISPPPRRPPSSLQKLLRLWNREQVPSLSQPAGSSSPGQLSPGQVILTGHSVDNTEFQDQISSSVNIFFSPEDETFLPTSEILNCSGDSNKLLKPNGTDLTRPKSESGSHNSNPHCNEVAGSTPKAGDGNKPSSSAKNANGSKRKSKKREGKTKRKKVTSSRRDIVLDFDDDYNFMMPPRPPAPGPTSGVNAQLNPDSEEDSEGDMYKFVNSVREAGVAWQGTDAPPSGTTDLETGGKLATPIRRKSSPDATRNNRDELAVEKSLDLQSDNILVQREPHLPRRPRHSFPVPSEPGALCNASQPLPSGRTRSSSSGRRVRHPAGNGGSHSRLTSNTSEEGGTAAATTTLQQISANSITSTTELLGNPSNEVPTEIIDKFENNPGVHIATEHEDTSAGATHAFQDEHGNWFTYTFGEATGTAQMLTTAPSTSRQSSRSRARLRTHSSLQSGDTSDEPKSPPTTRRERTRRINFPSITRRFNQREGIDFSAFPESDMSGSFTQAESPEMSPIDFILNNGLPPTRRAPTPRVKLYYKFKILPSKSIILQYDRLALLDLLDRNRRLFENILAIIMAIIVAVLGLVLLQKGFFHDVWPLWFCAVIATAQYSLVRSVQPDSASPTHGHNRVIAYSRPVYFCILAFLILLFDHLVRDSTYVPNSYIYANIYFTKASCLFARSVLIVLIMILPLIFLLGLLPQINTFIMYLAEQFEIHMFGGTACSGLVSALYALTRSILFCVALFGFCYGGMKTEKKSQNILFSVFCGLLISFSYHLSRQTNDPLHLWRIIRSKFLSKENDPGENANPESGTNEDEKNPDELSSIYIHKTLSERLQSDLILCPLIAVFTFAIHCSTAFTVLQPTLSLVLYIIAGMVGLGTHYVLPQLRKQLPWLLFSSPILKTKEYHLFEVQEEAKVMWFDKAFLWLCLVERNVIYPVVILNELTRDAPAVIDLYGLPWGSVILTFVGLKLLRSSYGVTLLQYTILVFSALFQRYDAKNLGDPTLVTYFLVSILFIKLQDLLLKLQFIYVYIAPWQITWGSGFHAFAQPFSVPHSGMLLLHTTISSLLNAPLAPFLGSAVFLTSYVRPLKFWERNYNTKRVDHSNTRLASQIDRGPSTDDNNLNSIFYEHLTLSLQKSLCGDIEMGRWGNVYPGDCFIMASDSLNALVHIIQRGNGVITFQLRGLEFSGTYCQQREVEAISEGVDDDFGLCCFRPGHARNMLSFNAAFTQRWLAWQVQNTKFVLEGYSITDNSATSMLGVYDLRKILLSYMVKSVIYFLTSHNSLEKWLQQDSIREAMESCEVQDYVDVDTSFSVTVHDDYDMWLTGISRTKFQSVYGKWIMYCSSRRENPIDDEQFNSKLVTLCFMVSVLSRRALGTASSHLTASHVILESFLYGLHSLFKGDFRITSQKDEWVFADMDLLHHVVCPGVRMSLKLHQDHFQNVDDEENFDELYDVISKNTTEMVITHEADPQWRRAVLSNRSSLLALRHVAGDAVDSYFVITLKRRSQGFRVVRVNKECVKGLWAGQQQELVFLRNSNPERGSIQNAKQVLRNMINSSCDQPIGYPIYVSPLTTSFSNTHTQYRDIAGGSLSVQGIRTFLSNLWICLQQSCGGGCNSGGSAGINVGSNIGGVRHPHTAAVSTQVPPTQPVRTSIAGSQSSGSQSNAADPSEQVSVNRMLRTSQPHRSLSHESRRLGRSTTDDYGSGNVFVSSSSLSCARPTARWRTGPDGSKVHGGRHPSGTGSMEMSAINPKYIIQPPVPGKASRNSRREGTESPANSDTAIIKSSRSSLPSEETRTGVTPANGSGKKVQISGIPPVSSSSSSMSRGDSLTVISSQLPPPSKSSRKSSSGGLEMEARTSSRSSSKAKSEGKQRRSKQKPDREKNQDAEKEMVVITDPSRVFEGLDMPEQIDFVRWPNDDWRKLGGKSKWGDWSPKKDMVGEVVYRWYPNHRNPVMRSSSGEVVALLKIEDSNSKNLFYVPIAEKSITPYKAEVETTQL